MGKPKKNVARLGDKGSHGGAIVTAASTIFVNGKPMARVGDMYACPKHGSNPIVTGATSVLGEGKLVAYKGSWTACGARIIEGSSDTFVGLESGSYQAMSIFSGPVPGRGIPQAEICAKIADVKSSKAVSDKLKDTLALSNKNGWEYAGWIIEDPKGNYCIDEIYTDKEPYYVINKPKPKNAVGHFHTHPMAGIAKPSDTDIEFVQYQKEKVLFYLTLASSGDEAYQNDEGIEFSCDD